MGQGSSPKVSDRRPGFFPKGDDRGRRRSLSFRGLFPKGEGTSAGVLPQTCGIVSRGSSPKGSRGQPGFFPKREGFRKPRIGAGSSRRLRGSSQWWAIVGRGFLPQRWAIVEKGFLPQWVVVPQTHHWRGFQLEARGSSPNVGYCSGPGVPSPMVSDRGSGFLPQR